MLAEMIGWERSRAGKAIPRWEAAGFFKVDRRGRHITLHPQPIDPVKLREFGAGENRERGSKKKRERKPIEKRERTPRRKWEKNREPNRESIPNSESEPETYTDKPTPVFASVHAVEDNGNAAVSGTANTSVSTAEIPPLIPHQDTSKMWPFTSTKPTPIPASVAPTSSPVAKYNMNYDGAVPSTYAEHLDWKPAPKASTMASTIRTASSPGFDATNALRHASWPERLFLLIALGLSGTAAYISVYYGMTVLFPAAGTTILVLGGFIEAAKFLGFGVVSAGWSAYSWFGKWVVAGLLMLAAVVNAAAVYGWLIASHAGPAATRAATHTQQDAGQGANVEVAQGKLSDIDRQIARMDADIGTAQRQRQNNTAERLRRERKQLSGERDKAQREVSSQQAGRATTTASHQIDEATMLPIRYAAMLFEDVGLIVPGTDPEKLMRWLAFMILLTADPLALAAMFMVNSRARRAA
jgi:hypothetical protein